MKIKLQQLWDVQQGSLSALASAKQINAKAAYRISKIIKKLSDEIKDLNDSRNNLIKKYGEEKEGSVVVSKDKTKEFIEEFNDLLKTEIEVSIEKLPFECVESIQLTPIDFINLDWLIEEPSQQPEKASTPNG